MIDVNSQPAPDDKMTDWFDIGARCKESFPILHATWNEVCSAAGPLRDNHPVGELRELIHSAILIGQHTIYSSTLITRYTRIEANNVYQDYVLYYFYNFIGRIMSSSDIFGLIINHVYSLELEESKCGLHRGSITNRLDTDKASKELSVVINRARDQWLIAFYHMRNLVLHRTGIKLIIGNDIGDSLINIQLGDMLSVPSEREILEKFLLGIGLDVPPTCILDPVILCEHLFNAWQSIVNEIMIHLKDRIPDFIDEKI
ncbi:MAG: hypothetical protein FVQ84_07575 [Planctomycetes bacterium]|nr:hypothetical protein [Planctomycetota bacterium]